MTNTICPQRVLKSAIEALFEHAPESEEMDNLILELQDLARGLPSALNCPTE